jgi:hypothetical protein
LVNIPTTRVNHLRGVCAVRILTFGGVSRFNPQHGNQKYHMWAPNHNPRVSAACQRRKVRVIWCWQHVWRVWSPYCDVLCKIEGGMCMQPMQAHCSSTTQSLTRSHPNQRGVTNQLHMRSLLASKKPHKTNRHCLRPLGGSC